MNWSPTRQGVTRNQPVAKTGSPPRQEGQLAAFWLIAAIGLCFGLYFVLRYGGRWGEIDGVAFAGIIARVQLEGTINYAGAYPHGYAYATWVSMLSYFTGRPIGELIQIYTPILGNVFLGIFGFAAFRRWLGSDRLGLIAASVLFLVPELVFTVSRGNHEKITVALTLLASLSLLRGFLEAQTRNWGLFAAWVAVYYLVAFALVTLNIFFGSSFIVASTLALIFALLFLGMRRRQPLPQLRISTQRLALRVGASWLLVMLVVWYIYPIAGQNLEVLKTALAKLGALALSFTPESNPYESTSTDWTSPTIYRLISSFRWILFLGSFAAWLMLLIPTLRIPEKASTPRVFLLALYGAFGLQLAAAIPVDLVGLESGSNLQVRMYTYFAVFAAPLFTLGLSRLLGSSPGRWRVAGVAAVVLAVLSLLKATLDPLVSNRWMHYHAAEIEAIHTWSEHEQQSLLWVGPETRLYDAYYMEYNFGPSNLNDLDVARRNPYAFHTLNSSLKAANSVAWGFPQSTWLLGNRVYDNGEAQIFHRAPQTPFQR
ncbi:MAG: hypothetical protein C4327_00220 [Meiothermus sp.]